MPTLPPQPHLSNTVAAADDETMATQQKEGWPLGLRPLDVRSRNMSASLSYSTLRTSSPSRFSNPILTPSITRGSLIGVSNIKELSQRSSGVMTVAESSRWKLNCKSKNWCFLLCSKLKTDAVHIRNALSLGHFMQSGKPELYTRDVTILHVIQSIDCCAIQLSQLDENGAHFNLSCFDTAC